MSADPILVRLYRKLLVLYPSDLRRAHGEEMVEVVRRRWAAVADQGWTRRGAHALYTLFHAVVQGVAARLEWGVALLGGVGGPGLTSDVKRAARGLLRTPGFTLVAVLTLALGVGANTAIYSVVEAVLLDPLPYPESDRLLVMDGYPWTPSDIPAALRRSGAAVDVAGSYPRPFILSGDEPLEVQGVEVSPGFFSLLGATPLLGRTFVEADGEPGAEPTVVIAHGLWQRRFGGDPGILGRAVRVDGTPHEIVGVMDRDFRQLTPRADDPQLWVPVSLRANTPWGSFTNSSSTSSWTIPLVRVGSGVPVERVQSELDRVMERFVQVNPRLRGEPRWNLHLAPLKSTVVGDVRGALLVLQLAVGMVLLLACVNVANLLLARASGRQQELAVRGALGASNGQLLRHLVAESLILSLLGGGAAVLLAMVGLEALLVLIPSDIPRIGDVAIDGSVLLFTLGVAVGTGLLFGLAPAARSVGGDPGEALKGGSRSVAGSRGGHRLSQALVVAQVSLTLVLFVGAGLLGRTFLSLTAQEPGFRTEDVVAVPLHVAGDRYGSVAALEDFLHRARLRVEELPGVDRAAVSNRVPLERDASTREFVVDGRAAEEPRTAHYGIVSPGYFQALDVPLVRGRYLEESDRRGSVRVAVIDQALWRAVWPGEDPVGKRLRFPDDEEWMTVVGVVGNVRGGGLHQDPAPGFYVSYRQRPETPTALATGRNAVLLVRSGMTTDALAGPLREAVWDVDPAQPVPEILTLEGIVSRSVAPERFRAVLLGVFAAIAFLLVLAGVYGVVASLVAERTREFGIRVAMGATPGTIVGEVLRWGLRLGAAGVALGLVGVLAGNRYLAGFLFGVPPTDPATLAMAVMAVLTVALVACLVPARRALSVDPVSALRSEGGGPETR